MIQEKQKIEKVNFIWTQVRYKNIMNGLMSKLVSPTLAMTDSPNKTHGPKVQQVNAKTNISVKAIQDE